MEQENLNQKPQECACCGGALSNDENKNYYFDNNTQAYCPKCAGKNIKKIDWYAPEEKIWKQLGFVNATFYKVRIEKLNDIFKRDYPDIYKKWINYPLWRKIYIVQKFIKEGKIW